MKPPRPVQLEITEHVLPVGNQSLCGSGGCGPSTQICRTLATTASTRLAPLSAQFQRQVPSVSMSAFGSALCQDWVDCGVGGLLSGELSLVGTSTLPKASFYRPTCLNRSVSSASPRFLAACQRAFASSGTRKWAPNRPPATKQTRACSDAGPFCFSPVRICAIEFRFDSAERRETIRIRGQVFGGEVRKPPYHLRALPAPHFLQRVLRRAVLRVPACPGMPQVMPAKVADPSPRQRRIPGLGTDLGNRACPES